MSERTLSAYVHVPYCRVRCGYCDFNTYLGTELRGAKQSDFAAHIGAEIALSRSFLEDSGHLGPLHSVFFGGGTPTLLESHQLTTVLNNLRDTFDISEGAEVTVESNPDSVDSAYLNELARAGVTRISFGVQSVVPEVLATLERTHSAERVPDVVRWARDAGLNVSIDLIYGSPGETLSQWQQSLDLVAELELDHVSAYSLIVEPGTPLARQISRGELDAPDPDVHAQMYELADVALTQAGLTWYEISNWARSDEHRSQHNLAYWHNQDWWGFGAGAHSHLDGQRWWNVKHPATYAQRVLATDSPRDEGEFLTGEQRSLETLMLQLRLSEGIDLGILSEQGASHAAELLADGIFSAPEWETGRGVLTLRGRLLADEVIRRLSE